MNPIEPPDATAQDLLAEIQARAVAQPWWRKFSNTVTAAAGAITLAIWLAAASGAEFPPTVTRWVTLAIAVLTVLGVVKTPNGTSPSQVRKVQDLADKMIAVRKVQDLADKMIAKETHRLDETRIPIPRPEVVADQVVREIQNRVGPNAAADASRAADDVLKRLGIRK